MQSKASPGKRSRAISRKARRTALKSRIPAPELAVTFRHVQPSDAIRRYAVRKLSHLTKFLKRPSQIHLIVTVDKYRHRGEVTVKSGYLTASAQEETKDPYSVIDLLADKVERQLKEHRAKTTAKKLRASSTSGTPQADSNRV